MDKFPPPTPPSESSDFRHRFPPSAPTPSASSMPSKNPYDKAIAARFRLAKNSIAFTQSIRAGGARRFHLEASSAECRRTSFSTSPLQSFPPCLELEQPSFDPSSFLFTFACEILPNWLLSPLFVLSVKGWKKGLNVIEHRGLLPIFLFRERKDNLGEGGGGNEYEVDAMKPTSTFRRDLVFTILQWAQWLAIIFFFLCPDEMKDDGIGYSELFIFLSSLVIRVMVIATKYAFYSSSDLLAMECDDRSWSPSKSGRKLLLAGWCQMPRLFPGLLQEQIETAMLSNDIDLNSVFFRVQRDQGGKDNVGSGDGDKQNSKSNTNSRLISAMVVLSRIVYSKFGSPLAFRKELGKPVLIGQFLIALTPCLTRIAFGVSPFGTSWQSRFVLAVQLASNFILGYFCLLFLFCGVHDFLRRWAAAKMLTGLVSSPGIPLEEFLANDFPKDTDVPMTSDILGDGGGGWGAVGDAADMELGLEVEGCNPYSKRTGKMCAVCFNRPVTPAAFIELFLFLSSFLL